MNTFRLSGRLASALALSGLAFPAAAQQCNQGPPTCTDGVPLQLPQVCAETTVPTFPVTDIPVEVPQYDGSQGPLVAVAIKLEFWTTGTISYTNNTSANCPLVGWSHDTFVFDVDSPDAPLCPDFPVEEQIQRSGQFINVPSMQTDSENLSADGFCDICPTNPAIISGPYKDAGNLSAFTGGGTVTFQVSANAFFSCSGCNPGACEADVDLNIRVCAVYYVCEEPGGSGFCECVGPSPHYRLPGSLLLFPEFDNLDGDVTVVTVTNVDCTRQSEDTIVEFKYIDKDSCEEFNREETLTPCDTLTLLTNVHNPEDEQGYLYVFAKDERGNAVVCNNLIGNLMVISGFDAFDYSINPVAFLGIGSNSGIVQPKGTPTDLDNDGLLDLDNAEYEPAPEVITIPRFLGQDEDEGPALFQSQLILIGLSGGSQFDTTIDCLLYNDNEESFSFDHTFECWEKSRLRDITFAFSNSFLQSLEDDPDEIVGAPSRESGWLCCDGAVASSTTETINDPAFYMVLVERVGDYGVADLPFECGFQTNGTLLPRDNNGDGDTDRSGDGIPDPVPGDDM